MEFVSDSRSDPKFQMYKKAKVEMWTSRETGIELR
jgi:hypothetical protein